MITSTDDALSILSKWESESTSLDVFLFSEESFVLLSEWFIVDVGASLKISDLREEPPSRIILRGINTASGFQYGESKDFPQIAAEVKGSIESVLVFSLGNSVVGICEHRAALAD